MPTIEQLIQQRMIQLYETVRSGATEMVGKTIRESGSGRIVGRHRGGMETMFPELKRAGLAPAEAVAAIRRGRGRRFDRLYHSMQVLLKPHASRSRSAGRPSVAGHNSITKKCRHCAGPHTTGQHRFHGPGAFHQTHLFAFNPPANVLRGRRPARRLKNPPRGLVKVAPRVDAILYSFRRADGSIEPHGDCDAECKRSGHRYQHDFEKAFPLMWNQRTGKLEI